MDLKKLGKYELRSVIGKGAMGVIYEGFDTVLQRVVAIKTMINDVVLDSDLKKRFYREARASGNLHHPNIITIFDFGEEKGVPFIVMEFLKGRDLKQIIQEGETLPILKIVNIGVQIAKGLNFAHRQGIIHRDIKPANIFICDDGIVKILDFGVAFIRSSTLTTKGSFLGSLGYMAPEQITGQKVDGRSDQYSLGVILYEAIAGVKPLIEKDISATIDAIVNKPPIPLSKVTDDCPGELNNIVMKCLRKNRNDRFPSLADVSKALDRVYRKIKSEMSGEYEVNDNSSSKANLSKTHPWLSLDALLEEADRLQRDGSLDKAFDLIKSHSQLYSADPEFETYFGQLKKAKEEYDQKGLFQKHYHEAHKLLQSNNFKLARLELETLLKIDSSSPLISQLENQISKKEEQVKVQEWAEKTEIYIKKKKWKLVENSFTEGDKAFRKLPSYIKTKKELSKKAEKIIIEDLFKKIKPLEEKKKWNEAVRIIRPYLRKFSENLELIQKYNYLMQNKLEETRKHSNKIFIEEQITIVDTLIASKKYEQAKKYLLVLLDKFPLVPEFEEKMIEIENLIDFQNSIKEIQHFIDKKELDKATETFNMLKEAYPDNIQIEILKHQLDKLKILLKPKTEAALPAQRLKRAVELANMGIYEEALEIIKELMEQNKEESHLITHYLSIKTQKEAHEKQLLIEGLKEIEKLENKGETFLAFEKCQNLFRNFPSEKPLKDLSDILKKRFVEAQKDKVENLLRNGELEKASATIETNIKLLPDEKAFIKILDDIDMEQKKKDFIKQEIRRAKEAVEVNKIDDAIEIINTIIPLDPENKTLKNFVKNLTFQKKRNT